MDYSTIASDETIALTAEALTPRGFEPHIVDTRSEALELVKSLIPAGASVNNGASRTLEEIGFIEYLKSGAHDWRNLHERIVAEADPVKKAEMRKESVLSDFYLGSVHAITETGEMIIASATGSQLPGIAFTSSTVIFIVGAQKIVPTFEAGLRRLREHVVPLEDARMKSVGMGGTNLSKILILEKEPTFTQRKIHVIIVREKLGF